MQRARIAVVAAALVLGIAGTGLTQTATRRLTVPVGGVRIVDVDYKIGFACDDLTILRARIDTRGDHNFFTVEGVAPGKTQCRVGTDANLPSYLFDISIEPKRAR